MTNILPPNFYGVDVALSRLRPGAKYQLEGNRFTKWEDPRGLPAPSWTEVQAQINKDMAAAQALSDAEKAVNQPVALAVEAVSTPLDYIPPAELAANPEKFK
jgi:hypothetical protein